MKKYIFILFLFFSFIQLDAEEQLSLKKITLSMEDDLFYGTDEGYSYGSKLLSLFLREGLDTDSIHIPFTDYLSQDSYISFALIDQIYTPSDLERTTLDEDDRPYAGYLNFETALYQATPIQLHSLVLQIGIVGKSSYMESLQKSIHQLTGSDTPKGWEHQLSDELTIGVNYNYKRYYDLEDILGLESTFIPEFGVNLGNASTKVYTGGLFRYGWGIPSNFGAFSINESSYSQIPRSKESREEKWMFCFNLGAKANLIAKDIFLDGNSNHPSHSVEKNNYTLSMVYGLSLSYKKFSFDWVHNYITEEFVLQKKPHKFTSFQFSYSY